MCLLRFWVIAALTYLGMVLVSSASLKELPEECFTYTDIIDSSRNWEARPPTSTADDMGMKKGWYRIIGAAGNSLKQGYDRPIQNEKDTPPNFCGTVLSGTLMGNHPAEEEGIVPMTVCFRQRWCYYKSVTRCPCSAEKIIYVRNCRSYFVYWLSPTGSQQRYCTGSTSLEGPSVVNGTSTAVECLQHDVLSDSSRMWDQIGTVTCDNSYQGWYRFQGDAGTELASLCTPNDKAITRLGQPCGAAFRGWMADRHPQLSEGRVERRICLSYGDSCTCEFFANVAVRNCGGFYVYRFDGIPMCNARYCGARSNETSIVSNALKPAAPGPRKDMCKMYKVMYDPDRLWSFTSPTVSKCDAHLYGKYRFGSLYTPWKIKEGCREEDALIITHRCGTDMQGFMEGKHPEVIDGVVERIICFTDVTQTPCQCSNTSSILVQNCGDYFVYDFKGLPSCKARFCMVANNSDVIRLDPSKPPDYEIPEPYIETKPSSGSKVDSSQRHLITTTTVLALIVFIIIILLVVVIILLIVVMRRTRRRRQRLSVSGDSNENKMLITGHVEHHEPDYSSSKGPRPVKAEDPLVFMMTPTSSVVPPTPPPSHPPPSAPEKSLDDSPEHGSDDSIMVKGPSSDDDLRTIPEDGEYPPPTQIAPETHSDEEEAAMDDYDTLLKDQHKPKPYEDSHTDSLV